MQQEEFNVMQREEGVSSPTMVRNTFEFPRNSSPTNIGADGPLNLTKHRHHASTKNFSGAPGSLVPKMMMSTGVEIPTLGLGTWKSKPGEVTQAVQDAIDTGYRHIDCAFNYLNEAEVGAGIKSKVDQGVVERGDLFVCSKLWNTFHQPDLVETALKSSLKDLQLEYLDLYLIHFPTAFQEGGDRYPRDDQGKVIFSNVEICDTWKAMEELVRKGLVKTIGVSNFNSEQLDRVLKCATIPPAMNQIEMHPYLNQRKLVEFCKARNVAITAYSPLRSQDRSSQNEPSLLEDPILKNIAAKYNKSVAQVIIRWVLQRGVVVIPKSVNKQRLAQNINVFDFHLSDEDIDLIHSLNRNQRANSFDAAKEHKEYPFSIEF